MLSLREQDEAFKHTLRKSPTSAAVQPQEIRQILRSQIVCVSFTNIHDGINLPSGLMELLNNSSVVE